MHPKSCPYLGLQADRASLFTEPAEEHRCYVAEKRKRIDLDHQASFCLNATFEACPRFVPPPEPAPSPAGKPPSSVLVAGHSSLSALEDMALSPPSRPPSRFAEFLDGVPVLQVGAWIVIMFLILGAIYGYLEMRHSLTGAAGPVAHSPATVASTPTPRSPPMGAPVPTGVIPVMASTPMPPPPVVTPPPGRLHITLYPAGNAIGWVSSDDPLNHFGDRNLHVGVFEDQTYYGAMQFDLTSVPVGSTIEGATLELMGLSTEHLGSGGTWALRLLSSEADEDWVTATYDQIRNALVLDTILPELQPQDLAARQANVFVFTPAQLSELERRLETGSISFRLDGPTEGMDNLFTWDTGYGGGFGTRPVLRLGYQLPPTPTPIVILPSTATPTPGNAVTAAALAATATHQATVFGTPTPSPATFVTATPPLVVTNTPVPENTATAQWMAEMATAEVFLHGTPTPLPTDFWTATPSPPPPTYAIVTSTPTPESVFTVVALAATATRVAATTGTYTPVPENLVTPFIVTSTPTPANNATALYQDAVATAEVIAYGTPTATPINVWTATPTPVLVLLNGQIPTPAPTPTRTATPQPIPSELVGKIAFLSDRAFHSNAGTVLAPGEEALPLGEPLVYVVDPDGNNLALLSDRWPHDLALERDSYSSDQRFRVFVKDAIIDTGTDTGPIQLSVPALFFFDFYYKVEEQITQFGADDGHQPIAYEPAWSPDAEQIAFVSNNSGNDEIWVINRDGSGARQLTWDQHDWWDKHPSWSPDGSKIVFWSNRTGNRQIWVMDADGGNLYSLSRTGFNDWDPVWIKYTDPPRDPTQVD